MPAPRLTISVDLPAPPHAAPDLTRLPPRPGVFVFEDAEHRTIVIGITADLRRHVRARLTPAPTDEPSRRVDYRAIARTVRATTVGSSFEADWAYLELARQRLPHTCRALFDRWRAWFVRGDPDAAFPRFVRTSTSEIGAKGADGVHLGPFSDKHDAQRAIEALESGFDLCRYHHILVQAPRATACAYKEMGKCPAPCDGSVSMDHYRGQMRRAIAFAETPDDGRAALEAEMKAASGDLDFERAERLRQRIDAVAVFGRAAFAAVDRIDRFRYLAVLPSEDAGRARLMIISGGLIEPWADIPLDPGDRAMRGVLDDLDAAIGARTIDVSPEGAETIGLVCWHLFRPAKARGRATFIPTANGIDDRAVRRALRLLRDDGPDAAVTGAEIEDR